MIGFLAIAAPGAVLVLAISRRKGSERISTAPKLALADAAANSRNV